MIALFSNGQQQNSLSEQHQGNGESLRMTNKK